MQDVAQTYKSRCVADSIDDKELPQFTRHLLTMLLNPKQAKRVQVESTHRLQKSPRAPAGAFHDVLLSFLSTIDKMVVMTALNNRSPYQFEGMQLTFLQDLCRATLTWRRSVRQVTETLRAAGVKYCWRSSMLTVTKGASTFRLMSPDDSSSFLGKLGLDAPGSNYPTP
ncbi:Hypothetical predicted protein [Pelobates cultripes]|uniref:Uncharacterized protein n=1 Tax=Pelobates cultripes TaxID=61616 RepID=A0AAD1RH61_PELCU|nr:Hypothetical predicted protein [Pelobates cultripes]